MHNSRLLLIKTFHTLVFWVMSASILYILYCGLTRTYNWLLAVAVVIVGIESLVFLLNGRRCPLTKMAERSGAATGDNWVAHIYLPMWFTPYVTPVCGTLFVVGLLVLLLNFLLMQP